MKKSLEKNNLRLKIDKDIEKQIQLSEYFKKHKYKNLSELKPKLVNNFLLAWSELEQLLLPSLIRQIAYKLKLKDIPNLSEKTSMSQLINYYYFISHDFDLYNKLKKGNKNRNDFVHNFMENHINNDVDKKIKEFYLYTISELLIPILKRLKDDIEIPVLTLYSKGWNDFRENRIKYLKGEKEKILNS